MSANHPMDDDKSLHTLLREWKVKAPLPPRFREQVWRRVEREETQPAAAVSPWTALQNWIDNMRPRPALAVVCVAVLLASGAGLGWTQAQQQSSRVSDQLSLRYVQSVDPYQALR